MRPSNIGVTGDVICWNCEMMCEVGLRQLIIDDDDGWEEMRRKQRFQDVMVAKNMNEGRE